MEGKYYAVVVDCQHSLRLCDDKEWKFVSHFSLGSI